MKFYQNILKTATEEVQQQRRPSAVCRSTTGFFVGQQLDSWDKREYDLLYCEFEHRHGRVVGFDSESPSYIDKDFLQNCFGLRFVSISTLSDVAWKRFFKSAGIAAAPMTTDNNQPSTYGYDGDGDGDHFIHWQCLVQFSSVSLVVNWCWSV